MKIISIRRQQLLGEYAEFHGIPTEHVRATLDGPDEQGRYTLRLDSYEHPACETETYTLTDGTRRAPMDEVASAALSDALEENGL